jgi:predicted secreted protein
MAIINSSSFLLFRDDDAVGHSKDVTVNLRVDLPDASSKDSNGWKEVIACARGGEVNVKGLTDYNDTLNFKEFCDDLILRRKQVFYLKQQNNTDFVIRGEGFVSSVDETAEYEKATTFDLEIQLTGIFTAGDSRTWENIFDFWEDIATNWENT